MKRKINISEFEVILQFCKKKGVDFVDLRVEVADHLAQSVEHLWQKEPELSLHQALMNTFKSFGVYGFTDVMADHQKQMTRSYIHKMWKGLQSLVTFRNLGILMVGSLFVFQMMQNFERAREVITVLTYILLLAAPTLMTYRFFRSKRVFKNDNVLLLSTPIQFLIWFNWALFYMFDIFSLERVNEPNFAIQLTLFLIGIGSFYLISLKIQSQIHQEIHQLKLKLEH